MGLRGVPTTFDGEPCVRSPSAGGWNGFDRDLPMFFEFEGLSFGHRVYPGHAAADATVSASAPAAVRSRLSLFSLALRLVLTSSALCGNGRARGTTRP